MPLNSALTIPMPGTEKAIALHYLGRYEEALLTYDNALELNPDAFVVWFNKGIALTDLGRDKEALQAYDKALELNPDDSDTWHRKGIALDKLGKNGVDLLRF